MPIPEHIPAPPNAHQGRHPVSPALRAVSPSLLPSHCAHADRSLIASA